MINFYKNSVMTVFGVLIFSQLIYSQTLAASNTTPDLLVQAIDEEDTDFAARKIAFKNTKSYDDYMAENAVSPGLINILQESFLVAQTEHLSNEYTNKRSLWLNVVMFAQKADWALEQRKLIAFSYFRLAQSAKTTQEMEGYLNQAINFDEALEPQSDIFPPPLIDKYKLLKKRLFEVNVDQRQFSGFNFVLVNGVRKDIKLTSPLKLFPGVQRLSFYSAKYQPVTRIINVTADLKLDLPRAVIATNDKKLATAIGRTPEPEVQTAYLLPMPIKNETAFYKKPKFWLGAAAVTVAAVLVNSLVNQNKDKNDRSTTTGY